MVCHVGDRFFESLLLPIKKKGDDKKLPEKKEHRQQERERP